MFVCTLAKAEADVQHLWFGRRAATHIRSELMAAIYDKALKRKDYSGIVDKNEEKTEAPTNGSAKTSTKKQDDKADEPKAGADVGKIVNLMAGDANKVSSYQDGPAFCLCIHLDLQYGQWCVLHLWRSPRNSHRQRLPVPVGSIQLFLWSYYLLVLKITGLVCFHWIFRSRPRLAIKQYA